MADGSQLEIDCETTTADSQTIISVQYSLNGDNQGTGLKTHSSYSEALLATLLNIPHQCHCRSESMHHC